MVYDELKELGKEVSVIRYSLIPEENVSSEELEPMFSSISPKFTVFIP
uniref:Uncharacterized protein n=1 Tax=Candidatus Methanogaster sp. ANME-2c ERB4 TaxID=2759911 RepID=A0A7G9YE94_9EURY|nr:hypothetical protein PABHDKJJ_00032 [Methanosarcinales archaeon ANME-2c ERB4]